MRRVFKFPLAVTDDQTVGMPIGAEILCVQVQDSIPCMWALCDPSEKLVQRRFLTHGTGHALLLDDARYVGTYQLDGGMLVFHVFEGER